MDTRGGLIGGEIRHTVRANKTNWPQHEVELMREVLASRTKSYYRPCLQQKLFQARNENRGFIVNSIPSATAMKLMTLLKANDFCHELPSMKNYTGNNKDVSIQERILLTKYYTIVMTRIYVHQGESEIPTQLLSSSFVC